MPQLGVNVDHIATVRQARRGALPDPVEAALIAESAGADSIVCHLREDRRHIQDRDVWALKEHIRTRLNLEMSIAPEIVEVAAQVRPWQATLVPERRAELTTEGGLDVVRLGAQVAHAAQRLSAAGIAVSVFIDPESRQIAAAHKLGLSMIELHTGRYAVATGEHDTRQALEELRTATEHAHGLGLTVNAGHGLDYDNVEPVAQLSHMGELNIGFAIIARAMVTGLETAVREMASHVHAGASHGARLRR